MKPQHLTYLTDRGIGKQQIQNQLNYRSEGSDLLIPYNDPEGNPYLDSKGKPFVVRRPFPTQARKFLAPHASGSRPYFSLLMADDHLHNHDIPLVFIEGLGQG